VTTAIIGVGHIGSTLAQHLVGASEEVALGALDRSEPEALAEKLGPLACGDSVECVVARADTVIFAVWLEQMKELIAQHKRGLEGKVVVDLSNPLKVVKHEDQKDFVRTLPVNQSAGSVVAARARPEAARRTAELRLLCGRPRLRRRQSRPASVPPWTAGQPPAFSGIDVGLVRGGQIAQLYTMLTAENRPSSSEE
jgi:glutamyl-tRNA reductase